MLFRVCYLVLIASIPIKAWISSTNSIRCSIIDAIYLVPIASIPINAWICILGKKLMRTNEY
ncbi:uncharacterized protein DS421_17g581630 [Arachis hypogaea]|nr:uncharacterized protein DS421_17g581630 [Arachis hypogaea]